MTHQEIKALAGHRAVPPWVMKLVGDAITVERKACIEICENYADVDTGPDGIIQDFHAHLIKARK